MQMPGVRHATCGIDFEHFEPVGAALLDTLASALAAGFEDRARAAWTVAFGALAGMMVEDVATALRPAA